MKLKFVFFTIFLSTILNAHHYKHDTIKIAYASNWAPYSYRDKKTGKADGVLIRILDELLHNKLGMKILHEVQPWARAQISVKIGNLDAIFTKATKDRLEYTISSKPFYALEWYLFVSSQNIHFEDIMKKDDPLNYKEFTFISLLGDKTTQNIYDQYGLKYDKLKSVTEGITMLDSGRASLFLHSKLAALSSIYNLKLSDKIKIHKKKYKKINFSFLISKKNRNAKKIITDLNQLIDKMTKDGSLKKLIKKLEDEEVIKLLKKNKLY